MSSNIPETPVVHLSSRVRVRLLTFGLPTGDSITPDVYELVE